VFGEIFHQRHLFRPAAPQHRATVTAPQISHPVRLLTEHRDQIPLTLVVGDDDRKRNQPPGFVTAHLECGSSTWPDAGRKAQGAQPICQTRGPTRTAFAILPSLKRAHDAHGPTLVLDPRDFPGLPASKSTPV
jgi:hypothetical protein